MFLKQGSVVRAKRKTYICYEGEMGIVIDAYGDNGVFILFESGGFDGFGKEEQGDFLIHVANLPIVYRFKSTMQLGMDFRSGMFTSTFAEAHRTYELDHGTTPY